MAVTTGARTGVTLWSDPADPVERTQFTATHQALEDRAAVDYQQTLPLPAAGVRGRYLWVTDDRGGRLYRDDGANLYDLGPKPIDGPATGYTARITGHPSAAVGDVVLLVRGKTGQTGALAKFTDPTGAFPIFQINAAGGFSWGSGSSTLFDVGLYRASAGKLNVSGDLESEGAFTASFGATIIPSASSAVPLTVNGRASQSGDLQQWMVNGTLRANMTAAGLYRGPDGTTGAPAYSFVSATTIGMYRLAGTVLGFAGGRFSFRDPAGSSDILTATPSSSSTLGLAIVNDTSSVYLQAGGTPTDRGIVLQTAGAGTFNVWNGATTRLSLDSAGTLTLATGDLTLSTGAVRLNNTVSGRVLYQDSTATYVGAVDAARDLYLRAQGADAVRANATTVKTPLALLAGRGAFGATNPYVVLTDDNGGAAGRAVVQAGHPSATNTDLALQSKGAGNVLAQSGSATIASFGVSPFITLASGSDSFYIKDNSSPEPGVLAVIGGGVSLGNTNLYLRYHGNGGSDILGQVVLGAADSAGAGYRTMRLPN